VYCGENAEIFWLIFPLTGISLGKKASWHIKRQSATKPINSIVTDRGIGLQIQIVGKETAKLIGLLEGGLREAGLVSSPAKNFIAFL